MAELLIVSKEGAEALTRSVVDAIMDGIRSTVSAIVEQHVAAFIDGAARLPQPTFQPPAVHVPPPVGSALPETVPPSAGTQSGAKRFKMGKGSPHRYNDIAWTEVPHDEFDLHDAWTRYVEPIVEYDTDRAAENFRRAIRQDKERFEVSADMRRARKKRVPSGQEPYVGLGL